MMRTSANATTSLARRVSGGSPQGQVLAVFVAKVLAMFSVKYLAIFPANAAAVAERGRDQVHNLKVDFLTAARGGERVINITRSKRCETCAGTGAKPGSSTQLCNACGGGVRFVCSRAYFR
ncbi:MAG: hypothetical protein R3C68_18395 [Myxococcota bacterium]